MTLSFRRCALIAALASTLSGCVGFGAASYNPYMDTKNVDMSNYQTDLSDCRILAENAPHLFDAVGTGAASASGALGGAATGAPSAIVAGAAASGAAKAVTNLNVLGLNERHIVDQCLRGRGYRVLGDE